MTWWPRFKADRPPLDAAQGAPVQVFFGKNDALISPGIAYCARDKMVQDMEGGTTPLTVCGDADADHTGVVRQNMQWGLDWIGARLLGAAEPAACDSFEVLGSTSCQVPPGFAD